MKPYLRYLTILLTAFVLSACGNSEVLLRDMTERDANEIISALYIANINSSKATDAKGKTFSVLVAKDDLAKSVAVLRAQGLPREARLSLNEVFKSSGFAPTAFEERVRFVYGTAQELERTISYMEGVLNARVHVVIPERARRAEVQNPPSASVFIGYDDKVSFDLQVPKVRRLVAESIEGLDPANVDVFISPIKVDLAKVASTPVVSFLGINVAKDSAGGLAVLLVTILGLLGVIVFLARAKVLALLHKVKDLIWKMYP